MTEESGAYRVLARKYRPQDFSGLIGQDAMVRTLRNAIAQGRLAHAFMLTGVRGVGKTTTARILARAFNCTEGPTMNPCGVCDHCRAIGEDSHVDVIEMDAASRTGVNDIRELIEGVRYRPVSARYKVYIIDEVHMLSMNAFNALLKTLEEPPAHVKFIFATTEIRKVPVTVLSRCQRFDLRRIDEDHLVQHFGEIAKKEGVDIEPVALALIARAADGSARDGLSLLDQAFASTNAGRISAADVRDMLGLADRTQLFELLEFLFAGKVKDALDLLAQLFQAGADPAIILQDLLDITHWVTRVKVTPDIVHKITLAQAEKERGPDLAQRLTLPLLGRAWQMLLKGLGELQSAPDPAIALEMLLIRFMHLSHSPSPEDLMRVIDQSAKAVDRLLPESSSQSLSAQLSPVSISSSGPPLSKPLRVASALSRGNGSNGFAPTAIAQRPDEVSDGAKPRINMFADIVDLARAEREAILSSHLSDIHIVHFEQGRIEYRPGRGTPADFANRLSKALLDWTGQRWLISISTASGGQSLNEVKLATEAERLQKAKSHPLVMAALRQWPGATIEIVMDISRQVETLQETDEETGMEQGE